MSNRKAWQPSLLLPFLAWAALLCLSVTAAWSAEPENNESVEVIEKSSVGEPWIVEYNFGYTLMDVVSNYPPDPETDREWTDGAYNGVGDIQAEFNAARTHENSELGTTVPMMTLPSQSVWDAMTDGEKVLWLIHRERVDRGVASLHDLETNVTDVAQNYADYLLANDATGHTADGSDPWARMDANPTIGACREFLSVGENLAYFWTTGTSISLPLERSVYMWMYDDSGSSWGHRHAILWYPYNDNSGPDGLEGFLGIGRASGPHQGWNHAEIIVMNIFDPCSSWLYASTACDFDCSTRIDLGDPISGLRMLADLEGPQPLCFCDNNYDGRIGISEIIYLLQTISGERP